MFVQLECYYNTIINLRSNVILDNLNKNEVNEIINWDAEDYRINLSK